MTDTSDFFQFKRFITADLLRLLYVVGALFITAIGFILFVSDESSLDIPNSFWGLILISVGNLLWRLYCEFMIVIFSIHERLVSIDYKIKNNKIKRKR